MPLHRVGWLVVASSVGFAIACGDSSATPSGPISFGSSGNPGSSGQGPRGLLIARYQGAPLYAAVSATVDTPLAIQVSQLNGQAAVGVPVRFAVIEGGGTLRDTLAVTDSKGIATSGGWTLGANEGINTVVATITDQDWSSQLDFHVQAIRMDGLRYTLFQRDGAGLRNGDGGFLLLAADSTFRTVWTWGIGSTSPYVAVNIGRYTRSGSTIGFSNQVGYRWADGDLTTDVLTFSYDDSLDIGFPSIVVEVYQRAR